MKKLLSIILCLVLVCALLPAAAFADDITDLYLTVAIPEDGLGTDAAVPKVSTDDAHIYAYEWYDSNGNQLFSSDTFKAGETYKLTVVVSSAKAFTSKSYVYLNGALAAWEYFGSGNNDVKFSRNFTARKTIKSMDIEGIAAPEAGGTRQLGGFEIIPGEAVSGNFTITYVEWQKMIADIWSPDSGATFEANTSYRLLLTIQAPANCVFNLTKDKVYPNCGQTDTVSFDSDGTATVTIFMGKTGDMPPAATKIASVALNITAPAAGAAPEYSYAIGSTGVEPYPDNAGNAVNGVLWRDETTGKDMKSTDKFQAGHSYTVVITLKPLPDYAFTYSTVASVNGETVAPLLSGEHLNVYYTFPAIKTEIDGVSVTVTKPAAGKTPVYSAVAGLGGQYTIDKAWTAIGATDGVGWAHMNSKNWNDPAGVMAATDKFEDGEIYMACIAVKPNSGYAFDAALLSKPEKALVNGYGAAHVEANGDGIIVYYVFPPAATAKEITKVELTVTMPKLGEKADLSAKLPADANYTLEGGKIGWYIDEDNAFIAEGAAYEAKTYIFSATLVPKEGYSFAADPQLSATLNGEPVTIWTGEGGKALLKKYVTLGKANPFTDVFETDYFYDAVIWAYYAEPQVTNGIGNGLFAPNSTVKRCEAVTFLWRAVGCPEPTTTKNPFEDVKETDYFYKPVLWAVEKGITKGTDDTHFTPDQTCSTAHIITFLYRTLGIGADGWGEVSAAWAKGAGLLEGLNVTVAPGVDCPRRDVVLFLYRAVGDAKK